jgi:ribonuclease D
MQKPRKVIMSNWQKYPLDEEQLAYAAKDAEYGREILEKLMARWLKEDGRFQTKGELFRHFEPHLLNEHTVKKKK